MAIKWPTDFPKVIQLTTIAWLKKHKNYIAAKAGCTDAAYKLACDLLKNEQRLLKINDVSLKFPKAVYVGVHAKEEAGVNKIPIMLTKLIGELTNQPVDDNIVQKTKVCRTGKDEIYRLAFRPKFDGNVKVGQEYILVDDVISRGGTLSELRFYIEKHGGKVVQMIAFAASRYSTNIALTEETKNSLISKYGMLGLQIYLKDCDLYEGNIGCLTEAEGRRILLDGTRDRIIKARQATSGKAFR